MKKALILAPMIMLSVCFANNEAEEFFYQRGLDAGYNQGYEQGVKDAFEEAKKILAKYKNEIRAYEIGKYFMQNGYITYPKVWQRVDNDGGVKIEIQPSKIEKQLNISDIFNKFNTLPTNPNPATVAQDPIEAINSVYGATRDTAKFLPNRADSNQNIVTISIEKNSKNEDILKKSNLVYSVDKNRLKVMFFNRAEKNNFCEQFKICN
ncbi:TPA: hypothetical protein RPW15_001476 [Campylobacter fetus subsp. venerealis]|nr:hypothetical protein [Campylobacter fetus subsp. venerealis]HDX6253957.1 hypothetical protein [Campylobacter fetus subsp. venerealis]HDX6258145.1 hypothetical protein [Campylobacter fetus subsp. venerealis]HDX6261804.1 hypothetical protein [Campylobacter fetus subsp. venerealis]HDX6263934.1 hypothetical protein [Campylobacter fetus subsp. venerealis]